MRKIPTLFERDWDGDRSRVVDQITPGCEWVVAGEGVAYRKLDGTCCMIRDGALYKRREVKHGKPDPADFELVEHDETTGKHVGWVPIGDGSEDRWHREAFAEKTIMTDATYELVGPKVQGNPEQYVHHALVRHDAVPIVSFGPDQAEPPSTFDELRDWFDGSDIEGIVWHHPDGRMAKIKMRDFGLKRVASPPFETAS